MDQEPASSLQPTAPAPARSTGRGLLVAAFVLSVCTFLGLIAFGAMMAAVAVNSGNATVQAQRKIAGLEERVVYLEEENTRFWIASDMFQFGLTDFFYTNNVLFCADNVVMMDIGVMSEFEESYAGEGKFNIGETNLKTRIHEMMMEFKQSYDNAKHDGMVAFEKLTVEITINNYDLATYENGVVTLEGEE